MKRIITISLMLIMIFIGKSSASENIVRINLARLAIDDQIDLVLASDYNVSFNESTILLKSGSKLNIRLLEKKLYIYTDNINLSLESPIVLKSDKIDSGFYINGSKNLYNGDLTIYVLENKLFPVLHIELEQYLMGVVPYEMSDSFPIEALKAQSIAARTYAIKHLKLKNDFDLVDTTNDQVYKGFNANNKNAIQAIKETEGTCGFDGNELATCYYSGSNGGQTELPNNRWNDKLNIYKMQDDKYDYDNPKSMVKRYLIKKDNPQLKNSAHNLLASYISEYAAINDYDTDYENIRIDKIEAISLHSPIYPSPSKVLGTMSIKVNFSLKKVLPDTEKALQTAIPSPTPFIYTFIKPNNTEVKPHKNLSEFIPISEPMNIDLNVFNDVRNAFGLGLGGGGKEIMNIIDTNDSFIIESRRFGHGVGMSQRGAEQMANSGKNYKDILKFYYPGMKLFDYRNKNIPINTYNPNIIDSYLTSTAEPLRKEPLPTPIPLLWDVPSNINIAIVSNIEKDSFLNLRQEPSLESAVVKRLYYGQKLVIAEDLGKWLHVFINKDTPNEAFEGYIVKDFVELESE